MELFGTLIDKAGDGFPGAASLRSTRRAKNTSSIVAEVAASRDPISGLHAGLPAVSRLLYGKIVESQSDSFRIAEADCAAHCEVLDLLESHGFIRGRHGQSGKFSAGLRITDPTYVLYMCALAGDVETLEDLVAVMNGCEDGQVLTAQTLQQNIELPLPVYRAVFQIYEANGDGKCLMQLGAVSYVGGA